MKDEILNKELLSPQDLKKLIPDLSIEECRKIIEIARAEMQRKGLYIPTKERPRLANKNIVLKMLGIKERR